MLTKFTKHLAPRLGRALRSFRNDDAGSVSIEAIIFTPLFAMVIGAVFSLHDLYHHKGLNIKAAYTISDAFSRQTDPVGDDYLTGMYNLLGFLTETEGEQSLRVTMVRYNKKKDKYIAEWSKPRGEFNRLYNKQLKDVYDDLPNLVHNERVVLVETKTPYRSPLPIPGLTGEEVFYNFGFTRPRFAPKIVWSNG
jgi:hypothetical protein